MRVALVPSGSFAFAHARRGGVPRGESLGNLRLLTLIDGQDVATAFLAAELFGPLFLPSSAKQIFSVSPSNS